MKMEDAFDDEAEQAVTIDEYLKEVEERELVGLLHIFALFSCLYACYEFLLFAFVITHCIVLLASCNLFEFDC